MRKANLAALLTLILSTVAFDAFALEPPQLLFSKHLHRIDSVQYIDILQSDMGEISGFILSDSANKKITVFDGAGGVKREISLAHHPGKIIHRYSDNRDTLVIYAVYIMNENQESLRFPGVLMLRITDDTVRISQVWKTNYSGHCMSGKTLENHIRFNSKPDGSYSITLGFSHYFECYELTQGPWWYTWTLTTEFTSYLDTVQAQWNMTNNVSGNFSDDSTQEIWGYRWDVYGHDFRESYDDPNVLYGAGSLLTLANRNGSAIGKKWLHGSKWGPIFSGNFDPSDNYHEIIYHGSGVDWLGNHANAGRYAICYSYSRDIIEEKWFTPLTGQKFMEKYEPESCLVGMHGCDKVVVMQWESGRLTGSHYLDHCIRSPRFVERQTPEKQLLLAGIGGDTLYLYTFESVVDAEREQAPLPASFTLDQNYPNPFNPETRIEYDLSQPTTVQLDVLNILGQRVRQLVDERQSAGRHSVIWDGRNNRGEQVGSGMYLYQLKTGESIASRKMVLLR
ncbi:MAG: FlgD immunoglobulin-like domain containing protein [candidate division Zixibacteria bacterium]|nr:FlgD immunoglobulin-like domain containing protein [candidate division Zixibacteria bacterium]